MNSPNTEVEYLEHKLHYLKLRNANFVEYSRLALLEQIRDWLSFGIVTPDDVKAVLEQHNDMPY